MGPGIVQDWGTQNSMMMVIVLMPKLMLKLAALRLTTLTMLIPIHLLLLRATFTDRWNQSQNRSQASHLSHLLNEESVDPIASRAQSTSQPKGKGKACEVEDDEAQEDRGQQNEEQVKRDVTEEEKEDNAGSNEAPSTPRKGRSSKAKGKQKAATESPPSPPRSSNTSVSTEILAEHSFATYTCPICFCPPTNATMTPCGHIACGSCLFTAVKTALRRENMMGGPRDDSGGPRLGRKRWRGNWIGYADGPCCFLEQNSRKVVDIDWINRVLLNFKNELREFETMREIYLHNDREI
ncbi:hypothetical protein C8R41DRAFT_899719 [Lentinula lateritia]|uniref:Zinc finger RING-type eukaryotic domain-containing protein n=1 Tax=Lentinula lateritia TaxID=40482 RepID=A0ABQ8W0X5_9AGAR|nr:hypothetical protein C8R41DRAFT_899719 [Lentinula lateritia]